MQNYELSPTAEKDVREVVRYTLKKWGRNSLTKYIDGLKTTFGAIGDGSVRKQKFSDEFPELLVTRYRYHFVFYIREGLKTPVIIGVIHSRRDIVSRLNERLNK